MKKVVVTVNYYDLGSIATDTSWRHLSTPTSILYYQEIDSSDPSSHGVPRIDSFRPWMLRTSCVLHVPPDADAKKNRLEKDIRPVSSLYS